MNIIGICLCIVLLSFDARTQVVVESQASKQVKQSIFGLGLSAGVASGFGLSFRHHLPGSMSYQIVGGIIKVDRKTHYNIGSELQFDIVHGERSRFFGGGAMGYFFSGENGTNDLSGPMRIGVGFGWEWMALESMHVSGELLFTYFSDGTVFPLPQVSAHYYFF